MPLWRRDLLRNANGKIKNLEHNITQVLKMHPDWDGVLAYDRFAERLVALREPPFKKPKRTEKHPRPWRDQDTVATMAWLQSTKKVLIDATRSTTENSIDAVGELNAFHPVIDYLESLTWDGQRRLPMLLSSYFGCERTTYSEEVGKAWMVSAIARIIQPGCQADYMLVLEGNQGARKSSGLRELFSDEWFTDARITLNDEGLKKMRGKWGVEVAELESFRGKAATEIKAHITSRVDEYRDSYGRRVQSHPRTCVMAGTTNEREYLVDRTGNRRFWPIACGKIDLEALRRDRNQLWAEALEAYRGGAKWWLESDALSRDEQRKREVREPWYELVASWTKRGTSGPNNRPLGFSVAEVMTGALNLRANDMGRDAQTRVGFCLHKLGFFGRQVRRGDTRLRLYFTDEEWSKYSNSFAE